MGFTSTAALAGALALGVWAYRLATLPAGYARPRTTMYSHVLNAALWLPRLLKLHPAFESPMTMASLQREASKRAKLTDWGDDFEGDAFSFRDGYAFAVDLLNSATLTPFGQFAAFDYLMRRLYARLRVINAVKEAGGRAALRKKSPVAAPVFVLGLPRCGTTLLHRLLSLDPNVQFPKTYELLDPMPRYAAPEDRAKDAKKRSEYWESKLDLIKKVVPQIEVMHELGANEAEECLLSMGVDVPMLPCTFRLLVSRPETVFDWQVSGSYQKHKDTLALLALQRGEPSKRWVLKCPVHIGFVKDLATAFPDAKIVWAHRDPAAALPSLASLFRAFSEMFEAGPFDLKSLGRDQLRFWSQALRRGDAQLDACGLERSHVRFKDLVKDPVAAVKGIYKEFGWKVTPEYEAKMVEYLAANRAKRESDDLAKLKKFHAYSLEMYGLTKDMVEEEVGWYTEKFGL